MTWPSTQTQTPPCGPPCGGDRHLDADLVELLALQLAHGDQAGTDLATDVAVTAAAPAPAAPSPEAPAPEAPAPEAIALEAAHVSACPACLDLVQERALALIACREDLEGLVDEALTDEALERQRAAIVARLVERADSGRVLTFPNRETRPGRRDRPALRWLASAAAAGLLVGVAAGQQLNPMLNAHLFGRGHEAANRFSSRVASWRPESARAVQFIPTHAHDELFLSEMETVLNYRGVAELRALDDLTPRAVAAAVQGSR